MRAGHQRTGEGRKAQGEMDGKKGFVFPLPNAFRTFPLSGGHPHSRASASITGVVHIAQRRTFNTNMLQSTN